MSKISEELIKLSSKPTVGGTSKRTIKLPSYAIKDENHAKSKIINNIIPIDSLKNNHPKTHKRTLCLNIGNTNTQTSTPIVENFEPAIKSFVESINSVVENFESQVNPVTETFSPVAELSEPAVENIVETISPVVELCEPPVENITENDTPIVECHKPIIEDITEGTNPFVQTYFEHFESQIEDVVEDIDPIDQLLEYLSMDSNCDEPVDSIVESPIITSEPKIEENINVDKKPVINLGSPFFYTPSVFKQYDITISDANSAEEDVHAEAKRILEESLNASKEKKLASQVNIINTALPQKTKVVKKVKHKSGVASTTKVEPASKNVVVKKVATKKAVSQEEKAIKKVATKKAIPQEEKAIKKVTTKKVLPQEEKVVKKITAKKAVPKEKIATEKVATKKVVKKVVAKNEVKMAKPIVKKTSVPENKVVIQPVIEKKRTASIVTTKPAKIKISAKSKELEVKKDFIDLDALISQDTVNEAYLKSINTIKTVEPVINNTVITQPVVSVEPIIKEQASPIIEPVVRESAKPVGILVETPNAKLSQKINTPKVSTFNSIFKKFSYDEAELINSANNLIDESPSISPINTISEVQQTLETAKIGQEKNVTELNVQTSPIATIPVLENDIEVITAVEPSTNYASESEVNILNVLTPQNNIYNSIEQNPIVTIEDLLNSNRNIKHDISVEEPVESVSLDIEPSVEEIKAEEIVNIEETKNEKIIKPDDKEFSIENYFNLENDISNSEENEILTYDATIGEELIDDNADIEFEIKAEQSYFEDEQNIIDEIIKELDEDYVFEDIQDYEIENQNENVDVDDIIIEDNNYKLVEESIFDNMLNDISLDDIDLEDLSSLTIADVVSENNELVIDESVIDEIEEDIDKDIVNETSENIGEDIINEVDIDIEDLISEDIDIDDIIEDDTYDEQNTEEINETDIDIEDLLNEDFEINEDDNGNDNEIEDTSENDEISSLSDYVSKDTTTSENEIESILEYAMSSNKNISNADLKEKLLTELFGANINAESDKATLNINGVNKDVTSDFLKVINTLTQTISKLEQKKSQPSPIIDELGKAINIEIDKDDIFSISILNETYEIVADFDGISVLSENIHISTPKNNFFVNIGDKYIEIHNQKTNFVVYTNFEDVEFSNALNNVAFTKKNNRIELTIKEAFKLSSGNNKISLSMLNTSIANIEGEQVVSSDDEESSVCDNKTLVISEETQKVYLPYTIKDIMEKLNDTSTGYQTVQDVIDEEYIVPLSEFKMPIISRFKESYRFMREKEKSSVYAALDLALELMFNSTLNPAVIRACKNLRELNIYLDCLYENELEKFDCFKVIYKVLPKIQ